MSDTSPMEGSTDNRSNREVLTQWRKLLEVRRQLTSEGKIAKDASAAVVLATLRAEIPPDLFM